jgi:hypothetical protein
MVSFQFQYPLSIIEEDRTMIHEVLERWDMSCEIEVKEESALITVISTEEVTPDRLVRLGMVLGINTANLTFKKSRK